MIASLPMYARTANRAAHDTLWALIRDGLRSRGVAAPDGLDHDIDHMTSWARPDLVLGQICNLPLRTVFAGRVTLIGAADYGLDGCPAGHYRSAFVVHRDCPHTDPAAMANARFVCNEPLSQSGYGAAQVWAAARGFQFRLAGETGAHHASISAVASGDADIAAIDAQTWRIELGENPATTDLKVIGYTDPSPGMTFVTRPGADPAPYFDAIQNAITALPADAADILQLKAIVALSPDAYDLPFAPEQAPIPA